MKKQSQQKLFPEDGGPQAPDPEEPDKPPEQRILDFVAASGEASKETLYATAKSLKLSPKEVDEALERLRLEGLIYSPKYGTYKTV